MAGKKWTENYNKFDHIDSDDSDDEKPKLSSPSTSSNVSPTSLDGSPVVHPTSSYDYQQDSEFWSNKSRIRSLPQNPSEVWQVTCCRLRCWTALPDKVNDVVIRPWAVLIACIYPEEGLLLGYDVNATNPNVFPTVSSTARRLAQIMLDPPSGNQRRPGKVVCDDASLGSDLYHALSALKVDCALMSAMPQATRVHADAVSTLLCKAGGASRVEEGAGSMGAMLLPSSTSVATTPVAVYEQFFTSAAALIVGGQQVQRQKKNMTRKISNTQNEQDDDESEFVEPENTEGVDEYFSAEEEEDAASSAAVPCSLNRKVSNHLPPWLAVPPTASSRHMVLCLTLSQDVLLPCPEEAVKNSTPEKLEAGESVWVGLLHDDDGILGIALFWSRLDCEARMKDPTASMRQVHRPYTKHDQCALQLHRLKMVPTSLTNSDDDSESTKPKLKRTKPRSFDVRSGTELCYNSAQSLKDHWPAVRKWSRPLSEREEGIEADCKAWHPRGEAVILFREHSAVAFEDWEFVDQNNLFVLDHPPASGSSNSGLGEISKRLGRAPNSFFPLPIALKSNSSGNPPSFCPCEAADLCWLTIACKVAIDLPHILDIFKRSSSSSTTTSSSKLSHRISHEIELPYTQTPSTHVTVSLDPVLLNTEAGGPTN